MEPIFVCVVVVVIEIGRLNRLMKRKKCDIYVAASRGGI